MKKRGGIFLTCALALSLVACSKGGEEANILGFLEQPVYGDLKFTENISTNMGVIPLESGDGVLYLADVVKERDEYEENFEKVAKMYDCDLGVSTELCTQEGCSHSDKSCPAWSEDAVRLAFYKYEWYTLNQNRDGDLSFQKVDAKTGKKEILYEQKHKEGFLYNPGEVMFSYGKAFIVYEIIEMDDIIDTDRWILVKVDLDKKEAEELVYDGNTDLKCLGGTEEAFYTLSSTVNRDELLSYDEFYQQYPDGEEDYEGDRYRDYYCDYCSTPSKVVYEIRKYDTKSGDYEVVCNDNVIQSGLGKVTSGNKFAYVTLNHENGDSAVYLYDMETDTAECLAEGEWIAEYSYVDDKIIYLKCPLEWDESKTGKYSYVDTNSKQITELVNEGITDHILYPVCAETNNQLLSLTMAKEIISKEDYYKEDYSKKYLVK